MGTHYAVAGVNRPLTGVQSAVYYLRLPVTGTLEEITFEAGAALSGDATFDVNKGSLPSNLATLFPVAADRPKILSGQLRGTKAVSFEVTKGDILTVDLDAAPVAGVPAPLYVTLRIRDAEGLRTTVTYQTAELADGAVEQASIPGLGRGWKLLEAEADRAAWLRLYHGSGARAADAGRLPEEDPAEGHGLCADVRFSAGDLAVAMHAPFPEGFNLDDPASTSGVASIKNESGAPAQVEVTLTTLTLEK